MNPTAKPNRSRPAGKPQIRTDHLRWYFACFRCNAKWFALDREMLCPRCQAVVRSTEQLVPPWMSQSVNDRPLSNQE